MKKLRPYIIGILGFIIGLIFVFLFKQEGPPSSLFLLGLLIGSISVFYLLIVGSIQFIIYLLKELGYADKDRKR